ncbi:hypothetical protein HK099_002491, partial [Clydaea vesicula]
LDQIWEDKKIENKTKLLNQEIDPDLPGLGQFYCLECAKYYISEQPLKEHIKSKVHKRRLKELKEKPYTQEDAEAAVGLKKSEKKKVENQMVF